MYRCIEAKLNNPILKMNLIWIRINFLLAPTYLIYAYSGGATSGCVVSPSHLLELYAASRTASTGALMD